MLITEFRIPMPLTVQEYQIGNLYAFSVESLNNTGGGDGVQVLQSRAFHDVPLLNGKLFSGHYTHKIYRMNRKAPKFVQMFMPEGTLEFHEESWNSYPYCKTICTNPKFMKGDFKLIIESMHCPDDEGDSENVLQLPPEKLKLREVQYLDIADNGRISSSDYKLELDPLKFKSKKTNRGPLFPSWKRKFIPVMTCYKLVIVEFKWFGLQNRVEHSIMGTERRLFNLFHRQIFCLIDEWYGMTMDDIRRFEDKVKEELNKQIQQGHVRGIKAQD